MGSESGSGRVYFVDIGQGELARNPRPGQVDHVNICLVLRPHLLVV